MLPWFHPLRKGQRVSAEAYNRLADQVAASSNFSVAWPLNMQIGLHGTHLSIDIPTHRLCRVVGVTAQASGQLPVYTMLAVDDNIIIDNEAPFASDSNEPTFEAYEINSNPHVPCDGSAVVWCWLSDNTGYWNFFYPRAKFYARITSRTETECGQTSGS